MRIAALGLGAAATWGRVGAGSPTLPVPCASGTCGATGAQQFVTSGTASAVATQNALRITQTSNSAILNWSSFNIGTGKSVSFAQPSANSIALNRIFQASPSQIFGQLTANGQVYLINLNGFIFGPHSTVNTAGLLASTLPLALTDANFANGILSPAQTGKPVLDATQDPLAPGVGRQAVLDLQGNPVLDAQGHTIPVQILVEPGAQISAADQGRLLLASQAVTNGGSLTAPDGQIILAAGGQVYLEASTDPALRGLLVEVGQSAAGSSASNVAGGSLSAARGNVTMAGLAVNQDGRISATTAVSANGSVRLEASDNGSVGGSSNNLLLAGQGGTLTIGPHSDIEVLPELASSATAVADQAQMQSSVTLLGEQIFLQGGSIVAPGGNLTAVAADPNLANHYLGTSPSVVGNDPNARLRIDPGTSIDLSGSTASLPVSANLVAVQLRASELADDPTQRNGPLHGQTVYIDARNPPPDTLANVQGEIAAIPQNVAQRTEQGGTASFQSGGDLVFAGGAHINVSGGATDYAGGVMQTSYLVGANGRLYPISSANPLLSYVGVLNPTFSQTFNPWGVKDVLPTPGLSSYQPGYVQGAAAGTVQFAAPTMVLQGNLQGNAVNGPYQRTPATQVAGGQLIVGLPAGFAGVNPILTDYLSPSVELTRVSAPIVVADSSSLPSTLPLELPTSYLTDSGFTSTRIFSNYDVTLPAGAPLALPPGSTLAVSAARVDLLGGISDPGGMLSFQNVTSIGTATGAPQRSGVWVGDGVTLDVSGLWTNDLILAGGGGLTATWQNGGSIALGVVSPGSLLSVGNGVALLANGGAWLGNKGSLTAGKGGSIAITTDAVDSGLDVGRDLAISGFGVQGAAGGTFSLSAPRIEIAGGSSNWTQAQQVDDTITPGGSFKLYSSLFSSFGFQNFDLNASGLPLPGAVSSNLLSVDAGTQIDATVSTLALQPQFSLHPSSASVDPISSVVLRDPYLRPAASISLSALPPTSATPAISPGVAPAGDVSIGSGAAIVTDAGGNISLTGLDSILVDGTLRAPGGTVTMQIVSPVANNNAYASFEAGFLPNQRIDLGPAAIVDVSGTLVPKPSALPLTLGTLYGGGAVNLLADRGAVVAEQGSLISVAGTTAPLDVLQANNSYGHEIAASAAGSITARSGESIFLLGNMAAAGGGGGTAGRAASGSLEIDLTRSESWWGVNGQNLGFNPAPMTVAISQQLAPIAGLPTPLFNSNQAWLGAANLAHAGFDALRVEAGDVVQFSGDVTLALGRSIVLDTPVLAAAPGAHATVTAPYLELGYATGGPRTPPNTNAALAGTGVVQFKGSEIDLVGSTVFQGASQVGFSSSGDLLLRGAGTGLQGSIAVAGNLTLDAARIYPTTATSFAITATAPATGSAGSITVGQTGVDPGTPYSAGGALSFAADDISSTGSIYAPFGSIAFNAGSSLTLGNGSLTSVSGGGLTIPYGQTQYGGQQWLYIQGGTPISAIPDRTVTLNAPAVTLARTATVDLRGGGDLLAYEWVPGPGGSRDQLSASAGSMPGLYAILPGTRGQAAPQDPLYGTSSSIPAAGTVFLSGGSGLPAGTYPLLPARYANVPGAYLIQAEPQMVGTSPGILGALADGTPVVAGYLSYGQTGLHQTPGYTGFAIRPGSYGGELAQYDLNLASTYFSAAASAAGQPRPPMPADAGSLQVVVGSAFNATGQVLTAAGSGGLSAPIEISANDLVIGNPTGAVAADAVSIQGSVLDSWHPGSLLLGGATATDSRSGAGTASGTTLNVLANSVTVGSGTALTADQIVLVANQSIDVQSGATLQTTSAGGSAALPAVPRAQAVTLNGSSGSGGAMLALSDLNWLIPSSSPAGAAASVTVQSGASLASRGSLSFAAPGSVKLNDGTVSGAGAEWYLGSSSVAFVPAGAQHDALSIDPALLTRLGSAGALQIASSGSLDFYTPTTLGRITGGPAAVTLSAASLNNLAGPGTTAIGAHTLTLQGAGAAGAAGAAGNAGANLLLSADQLDIGPGFLAVNGFVGSRADISGSVIGRGTGGVSAGGDLAINAASVTAASASDTLLAASGALSIGAGNGKPLSGLLGGELTLSGNRVDVAGTVAAPSGIVKINGGPGGVNVGSGAVISAAGEVVSIGNQSVGTPGGSLVIRSAGDLILSQGSLLDVSGAAAANGSGGGGSMSLAAAGVTTSGAALRGAGADGAAGGSFALDSGTLASAAGTTANPLTSLAAALTSGGFSSAIDLRVRGGNLNLDAGSALSANEISLVADAGSVRIGGSLSAPSGSLRGSLSIFGGAGVELLPGAALHADGSGATGRAGSIEIGAGQLVSSASGGASGPIYAYNTASILLDAGSTISALGSAANGTLLLRAPASTASNDVAIQAIGSNTAGVGSIVVEPVLAFNTNDPRYFSDPAMPAASDFANLQSAVGSYLTAAVPGISARLGAGGRPLIIEAGVEVIAPGNLTLPGLDLHTSGWNSGATPVDLTVRAAGDLTIAGTVSDGFGGTAQQPTLLWGNSSTFRLVSGADLSGANPLASVVGTGTLTLGPGAVVRTGTGDINLIAGRDIVVGAAGSGAYTTGIPAIAPGGSQSNPYPGVPATNGVLDVGADGLGDGLSIPRTSVLMSFPSNGGNLVVRAGGDIVGAPLDTPSPSSWQVREGGGTALHTLPMWGVNLAAYNWNFGTLGGGDMILSAGHDALNVTAAAAGSLLPPYGGGPVYVRSGGLSFSAGHDIGSAEVFLADGRGALTAGGGLTSVLPSSSGPVGSALFLQDSVLTVTARSGMAVDGIFNPTALAQNPAYGQAKPLQGSYFSYGDDSAANLLTLAGDVSLGSTGSAAATLVGNTLLNANASNSGVISPTFSAVATGGSIDLGTGIGKGGSVTLYPSAQGQLTLLASRDITGAAGQVSNIWMSDAAPGSYATVSSPFSSTAVDGIGARFTGDIHANDLQPARLTAGGSIQDLTLSIPKPAQLVAGSDIADVQYSGQNLHPGDVTLLMAGRDVTYGITNSQGTINSNQGISVGGPGSLDVLAGRNVTLGFSGGVVTTGNLLNADLPTAQGSDVTIATGLGSQPDYAGFVSSVIAPSPTYQAQLIDYVEMLQGSTGLSFAAARAAFNALALQQELPLVDAVFFNELTASGRAANTTPGAGFGQGYRAIDALFPGSRTGSAHAVPGSYAGNLTLDFSRIYTLSGGDINLLVPGGGMNVGLATAPAALGFPKTASDLGIVAQGPGNVNIYTRGDIDVNSSRIFTLGGGNIMIWSDEGSIDAGRGAKSAVSAPPPVVLINSDGSVTIDYSGAAGGSGIRTIQTQPGQALGSVDLIAPQGTVNAGDAGIGAAGNINVAARSVVGLSNISFGGTATGVPSEISGVGASVSGASSAASAAGSSATSSTEAAQQGAQASTSLAQSALSWLDVFVTGLGEDNCKPEDLECIKRQKSAPK